MCVSRDAGDAVDPEVEGIDLEAGLLHEDDEEPAQAGVHVHRDSVLQGQGGNLLDGVHHPMRVLGRRANNL